MLSSVCRFQLKQEYQKDGSHNEARDKRVDLLCQKVDDKLLITCPDNLAELAEVCDVNISGCALCFIDVGVHKVSGELGVQMLG